VAAVGALVLAALVLGMIGFWQYGRADGQPWTFWDIFYRALQLFPLSSGSLEKPGFITLPLQIARVLAPALAIYAAIKALLLVFYHRLMQFWVRVGMRRHVVICGLGGNGYRLAIGCYEMGLPVVVIESDDGNDRIAQCREHGVIVMLGNARDRRMLLRAGVRKARYLVAVSGNDGVNVEILMLVRELVGDRRDQPLTCVLHILDSHLCRLLTERGIITARNRRFRVHFFSVYERGARVLLWEERPFSLEPGAEDMPHLVVIGLGRLGQTFVFEVAENWLQYRPKSKQRLRITVVDRRADQKTEYLRGRYPSIDRACEITPLTMEFRTREFEEGKFLFGDANAKGESVTHAYVCLANDTESLSIGLVLARQTSKNADASIRIVVRTLYEAGIAEFLREDISAQASLRPFGLFDRVAKPDLLLDGVNEIIARAYHEDFLKQEALRDKAPGEERKPADKPWHELTEQQKEANRQRADMLGEHLKEIGCDIRPRTDWDAGYFEFTEHEITQLAVLEQERWSDAMIAEGWNYGPERDNASKIHPDIGPWERLKEGSKEYNRQSCRGIPLFLARLGYEVYRLSDESQPESQ
jgi:voltage-gated potassium channel Kch